MTTSISSSALNALSIATANFFQMAEEGLHIEDVGYVLPRLLEGLGLEIEMDSLSEGRGLCWLDESQEEEDRMKKAGMDPQLRKICDLRKGDTLLHYSYAGSYSCPTWAGEQLLHGEPQEGEVEYSYGGPSYEYKAWGPAYARVADDLVEEVFLLLHQEVPFLIRAWQECQAEARKTWGRQMNAALRDAGCSEKEIRAWWSMSWKKEVSPEKWANLLRKTSDEAIRTGLKARSGQALEWAGTFLSSSYPRSMDIVKALARAKGLKPLSHVAYSQWLRAMKAGDGLPPTQTQKDGSRIWSF